ncbi:MAG TPA: UrcA family protein, partial [Caulobacteraceae bacterium]|nr:UrcA family protein [Caulobacteraceae bacterium]
ASAAPLSIWGDDEVVSAKVTYTEAETRSTKGAKAIALRIRVAAAQVCSGNDWVARAGNQYWRCQHAAIDRAVRDLGAPLVADALGREPAAAFARR